jgi:hypothetical protein
VRDSPGLLQKPLLGYVQIDLRCFKEHHLYEFWLPLSGPSVATKAEIHITLQFNPMNITRPIASRLPSLRVHLHKFSFYPGEVVRGVVVFNVGKTMPAQRVFLQLCVYLIYRCGQVVLLLRMLDTEFKRRSGISSFQMPLRRLSSRRYHY